MGVKYEFYDRAGNLLGLDEREDDPPMKRDEEFDIEFEGQPMMGWKVIAVSVPVGGVQKVTVRPI